MCGGGGGVRVCVCVRSCPAMGKVKQAYKLISMCVWGGGGACVCVYVCDLVQPWVKLNRLIN